MENNSKKEIKTYSDYDIFDGKINLVTDNGMTVMERNDAIDLAHSQNMNLVQVGYNKTQRVKPICKMFNLSKFKYEQKKKEKENKRKLKILNAEAKEIVFSIRIDDGDKKTKIEHIRKFIVEDKMKVKVSIKLLRREMNLLGMAKELMHYILDNLNDIAEMDSNPSFNSGIMSCVLRPKS